VLFPVPALAERLHREFTALEYLASVGYSYAPHPVRLMVSGEVGPSPALAMEYIDGDRPGFSGNGLRDLGHAVRALHRLHPPAFLQAGPQTAPGAILQAMVAALWRKLDVVGQEMAQSDRRSAERTLKSAEQQAQSMDWDPREVALLHGDLGDHNMLQEGVTGRMVLIDWEFAAVSHPLLDLMWLFHREGFGVQEADAFLQGYGKPFPDEWRRRLQPLATLCTVEDAVWAQSGVTDIQQGKNSHYFSPDDLGFLEHLVKRLHQVELVPCW
jgi:aminoglycoside phosphotransferase (APT) family kinase protein